MQSLDTRQLRQVLQGHVEQSLCFAVIQVLSRYWALWGIVEVAPEATSTGALTLLKAGPVTLQLNMITLLFCWSVTEVLRYGFYAVKVETYPQLHLRSICYHLK